MHSITLFDAISDDIQQIREVQKIVWLVTYPNKEYDITQEDILSSFTPESDKRFITIVQKALMSNPLVHGWIAKDEEKIVGYYFVEKTENKNRINSLYVLPQYQGQGIGKQLLLQALQWLENNKPTVLEVASYNAKAIVFYKSFGFVENGPADNERAVLTIKKTIHEIEMIKKN